MEVSQERIDAFAAATEDSQWIHTDPARAADGPFGSTVAHGFLTLSLCVPLLNELLSLESYALTINYGVNRVRFPSAVPSGSRIRASVRVESVEPVDGGEQATVAMSVEREGGDRPVCVAELLLRLVS